MKLKDSNNLACIVLLMSCNAGTAAVPHVADREYAISIDHIANASGYASHPTVIVSHISYQGVGELHIRACVSSPFNSCDFPFCE